LIAWVGSGFGWKLYQNVRRSKGIELVATANQALLSGEYAAINQADAYVREALAYHPSRTSIAKTRLLIAIHRALENGKGERDALQVVIHQTENEVDKGVVHAARAVIALLNNDTAAVQKEVELAQSGPRNDPELLVISGLVTQRLGFEKSERYLKAAVDQEPAALAAAIALAELEREKDMRVDALKIIDGVLKKAKGNLRGALLKLDILADEEGPKRILAELKALSPIREHGGPIDRLLETLLQARLSQREGDPGNATRLFEKAFELSKSDAFLLNLVARSAFRSARLDDAKRAANLAVTLLPEEPVYRRLLAEVLIASRDVEGAFNALKPLPENEPYHVIARAYAALESDATEKLEATIAEIDAYRATTALLPIEMETVRVRLQARINADQALFERAKQLVSRAPEDFRVLRAVGEVALALGNTREANHRFTKLVAIAPDNADSHFLLGQSLRAMGNADEAQKSFELAIEIAPDHAGALDGLGKLHLERGEYAEADEIYQHLSRVETTSPVGQLGRADALRGLGRYKEATDVLGSLPKEMMMSDAVVEAKARVALAWGRTRIAFALLTPLTESTRVTASELVLLGDIFNALDRIDPASRAYSAALKLDPNLPEALFGAATVADRAGHYDKAIDVLNRLLRSLDTLVRPPEFRAIALATLGRAHVERVNGATSEEAYHALIKAMTFGPVPNEAYFWLGESIAGIRATEAKSAYRRYLELEPNGRYAARAKLALTPRLD
jgi:tetratricopeptide (TPR) repeat protein